MEKTLVFAFRPFPKQIQQLLKTVSSRLKEIIRAKVRFFLFFRKVNNTGDFVAAQPDICVFTFPTL